MGDKTLDDYGLSVFLNITDKCNYSCPYCYGAGPGPGIIGSVFKRHLDSRDIDDISGSIKALGNKTLVYLGGGEPLSFDGIIELAKKLSEHSDLDIHSNISHPDIYRLADELDPKKVLLFSCSCHIMELEKHGKVEDFIEKVNYLQDKGFKTYMRYVMYPEVIARFEDDYKFFMSRGVRLAPKAFSGVYKGRRYPESYTKSEKMMMLKYAHDSPQVSEIRNQMERFSFKGKLCSAGKSMIIIDRYGKATRCYDDTKSLGNIWKGISLLKKPKVCEAERCGCPQLGEYMTR